MWTGNSLAGKREKRIKSIAEFGIKIKNKEV